MVTVSVIIPAYNTEKYIKKTLDSLKKQIFDDFEVIIVNDGSTDRTVEVVTSELQTVSFPWKLINQENRGVSIARNNGLKKARGKYVYFIDSDDFAHPTLLEKMYSEALKNKNSDIIFCGFDIVSVEGKILRKYEDNFSYTYGPIRGYTALKSFLKGEFILSSINVMYKRDFLLKNKLYFNPVLRNLDDPEFIIRALYKAKMVTSVPEALVYYVQRPESMSRNLDADRLLRNVIRAYREVQRFLVANGIQDGELYELINSFFGLFIRVAVGKYFLVGDYSKGFRNRSKYLELIKKSQTKNINEKISKMFVLYFPWLYPYIYKWGNYVKNIVKLTK